MFDIHKVYQVHRHYSKLSLRYFLDAVVINSSPKPMRWGAVRESWQDDLINRKIGPFEALAFPERCYKGSDGQLRYTPEGTPSPWSFADFCPRGHDKTSLEGRLASWLLFASRRKIHGYILAADRDQGALVLQAMQDEASLNEWLACDLKFTRNKVSGPGGDIEIVPADAASAFGFRGNFYVADEWANWSSTAKARELWSAVYSGTEKMNPRILGIVSNAGRNFTWQREFYDKILSDPDFVHTSLDGPKASWMPPERIARLMANMPPAEARRLFLNKWIDPGEDYDFLSAAEIAACRDVSLGYRLRRKPLVTNHVASIDYGPKRDRTVCCIGHQDAAGVTIIDRFDTMQGSPENPVPTTAVRDWIIDIQKGFTPREYVVDSYGLSGVLEWMQSQHLPYKEFTARGGTGNFELAQTLRAAVASANVRWYPGCGKLDDDTLESELSQIIVKKMSYGFRIDHESNKHDDRAVALGMLLCRTPEYPWAPEVKAVPVKPLVLGEREEPARR